MLRVVSTSSTTSSIIESLEHRRLLTTITVNGTSSDDVISVEPGLFVGQTDVFVDGVREVSRLGAFDLVVDAGGGNDAINVGFSSGFVEIDGQGGTDSVRLGNGVGSVGDLGGNVLRTGTESLLVDDSGATGLATASFFFSDFGLGYTGGGNSVEVQGLPTQVTIEGSGETTPCRSAFRTRCRPTSSSTATAATTASRTSRPTPLASRPPILIQRITFNGGPGEDRFFVADDPLDSAATYRFYRGAAVTGVQPHFFSYEPFGNQYVAQYTGVEEVVVSGTEEADTFDVVSVPQETLLVLEGRGGDDLLEVTPRLDFVPPFSFASRADFSNIRFSGDAGVDTVRVDMSSAFEGYVFRLFDDLRLIDPDGISNLRVIDTFGGGVEEYEVFGSATNDDLFQTALAGRNRTIAFNGGDGAGQATTSRSLTSSRPGPTRGATIGSTALGRSFRCGFSRPTGRFATRRFCSETSIRST